MTAYLDNSATTCPIPEVIQAAENAMKGGWYNPSALYKPAMEVQKKLEETRQDCLKAVHAEGSRIIFTSGGTEADNLALLGRAKGRRTPGKVLVSQVEHPAVLACEEEIRRMGHIVEKIPVQADGRVDLQALEALLDRDVFLIAVMQVNNETGAIQPLREISGLRNRLSPEAALHVDGVQGFLRVPLDFRGWGIQSYAFSAHKIHGLKGSGALIVRNDSSLKPQLFGGGQEGGLRSGTENTLGILTLGAAIRAYRSESNDRMRSLKKRLWEGLKARIPDAVLNGPEADSEWAAPHILNAALPPVRSQTMLFALEGDGIYVSAGSACASRKQKISPVLKAMNVRQETADCSVRFSLCPCTTQEEIDYTIDRAAAHYEELRKFTRR